MELAKEELSDIHDDWIAELEKERQPLKLINCPPEVKEKINQFVHRFQTDNNGIVGFLRLSETIREHKEYFDGHHPGKTTLQDWYKVWKKEQANK